MNIKPLADRVLILPAPAEEKTIGGIIIPDSAFVGGEEAVSSGGTDSGFPSGRLLECDGIYGYGQYCSLLVISR